MDVTAYAASIGHSVWFSHDLGESWNRAPTPTGGIYNESRCWCVATHPGRPGEVLSGTDQGVYRWDPRAERWNYLPSPMDGMHILQIAQAPHDPDLIFAGHAAGAQLFRSLDGGASWSRCELGNATECDFHQHPAGDLDSIRPQGAGYRLDHHRDRRHLSQPRPRRVLGASRRWPQDRRHPQSRVHRRAGRAGHPVRDRARAAPQRRQRQELALGRRAAGAVALFPLHGGGGPTARASCSCRSATSPRAKPASCCAAATTARAGEDAGLPGKVNSTIWWIATNPADAGLIFCCTIMGQIFRSTDGGGKLDEDWRASSASCA